MISRKAGAGALAVLIVCSGCASTPTESQGPPVPQLTDSPGNLPVRASLHAHPLSESTMRLIVLGKPTTEPTPPPNNALAELADNKFESWTLSPRACMPVAPNSPLDRTTIPPEIPELNTLSFLETTDQPVGAIFLSFSGSRDAISMPDIVRQFSLKGGGSMRGITISKIITSHDTARSAWSPQLRRLGLTPVATNPR